MQTPGSQTKSRVDWSWKMPKRWLAQGHKLKVSVGASLKLGLVLLPLSSLSCSPGIEPGVAVPTVTAGPARLSRLTKGQYLQTLTSLLGPGLQLPTNLEDDTYLHGYTSVAASELTISPRAAEQFESAAMDLAEQIFTDKTRRTELVGCTPETALRDSECVLTFLRRFGLRTFRRPLAEDELALFAELYENTSKLLGDKWLGLQYVVAALLQSPHFLFRVERGELEPRSSDELPSENSTPYRLRYSCYEMASRLSYLLWETMPDDELLRAAGAGELCGPQGEQGLTTQAMRMLAMPQAEGGIGRFFREFLKLNRLDTLSKDTKLFPQLTPTLRAAMGTEIVRSALQTALGDADIRDLLTSPKTFVNKELATLYGLPDAAKLGSELQPVELPSDGPRAGILGTAGFLAIGAHQTVTSPTLRGRFIRENLLCQDIPPPPPGVATSLTPPTSDEKTTLRQRLTQHREAPQCRGCHQLMDPLGLTLENFDAIGAFREKENEQPIDASVDLDGQQLVGARALGQALHDHPRLGPCVARQLYRYATGHLETEAELGLVGQLGVRLQRQQYRFKSLLLALLTSEGFRYASVDTDVAMDQNTLQTTRAAAAKGGN